MIMTIDLCEDCSKMFVDKKRKELMIECDMLQGNINRMMVTDSREELYEMYYWASARLGTLLRENRKRIEYGRN